MIVIVDLSNISGDEETEDVVRQSIDQCDDSLLPPPEFFKSSFYHSILDNSIFPYHSTPRSDTFHPQRVRSKIADIKATSTPP